MSRERSEDTQKVALRQPLVEDQAEPNPGQGQEAVPSTSCLDLSKIMWAGSVVGTGTFVGSEFMASSSASMGMGIAGAVTGGVGIGYQTGRWLASEPPTSENTAAVYMCGLSIAISGVVTFSNTLIPWTLALATFGSGCLIGANQRWCIDAPENLAVPTPSTNVAGASIASQQFTPIVPQQATVLQQPIVSQQPTANGQHSLPIIRPIARRAR